MAKALTWRRAYENLEKQVHLYIPSDAVQQNEIKFQHLSCKNECIQISREHDKSTAQYGAMHCRKRLQYYLRSSIHKRSPGLLVTRATVLFMTTTDGTSIDTLYNPIQGFYFHFVSQDRSVDVGFQHGFVSPQEVRSALDT